MQNLDNESYRIGAVARLAGVPVATLRVWERRYAAFAPAKSAGQHRLYGEADVTKARLLRQLTEAGHGIGTIAHLAAERLQQMLVRSRAAGGTSAREAPRLSAAIVGDAIAARLHSPRWRATFLGHTLDIRHVFPDLQAVQSAPPPASGTPGPDLLLVRLNTVQAEAQAQLARALAHLGARHAIVLYAYGAPAALAALRAAGMIVRREPVTEADLAELIRSQVLVDTAEGMPGVQASATIPPRRFSDVDLARIGGGPNSMLCECPRHICELIAQLASFEEYSRDCLNRSNEDAQVHAYLRSVAGSARALFEQALVTVAQHDGLALAPPEA